MWLSENNERKICRKVSNKDLCPGFNPIWSKQILHSMKQCREISSLLKNETNLHLIKLFMKNGGTNKPPKKRQNMRNFSLLIQWIQNKIYTSCPGSIFSLNFNIHVTWTNNSTKSIVVVTHIPWFLIKVPPQPQILRSGNTDKVRDVKMNFCSLEAAFCIYAVTMAF